MQTKWLSLDRELLSSSVAATICIFVSSREVSYAMLTSSSEDGLVNSGDFIRSTWVGESVSATGIDSLIIQNRNVCLIFLFLNCLLLHFAWSLAVILVADSTRNSSWEEDDFFRRGMGDWVDFIWCFAGIAIVPILFRLLATAFNSWPTSVCGHYHAQVFGRDWLALVKRRWLGLDEWYMHQICWLLLCPLTFLIALTALNSFLLRNDRMILTLRRNVFSLKLGLIILLLLSSFIVLSFDGRPRSHWNLYLRIYILLLQFNKRAIDGGHLRVGGFVASIFYARPHFNFLTRMKGLILILIYLFI